MKMSVDRARRPWALRTATLAAVALCALLAQPHVGAAVRPSQTIEAELLDDAYSPEAQDWIIQHRRRLHMIPELAFEEFETSKYIRSVLDDLGIEYDHPVARTGIVARVGPPPYRVALRADIDGLPIQEATGLPFASTHAGRMHACGHDAHAAMLLGAARLLKARERQLAAAGLGGVALVFQPAEEGGGGAGEVVRSGKLEGVEAMFGMHVWPDPTYALSGVLSTKPGPMLAASTRFGVTIQGRGGHAAMPHTAIDPVVAAAQAVLALQPVVSRETSPVDPVVVSVTRFNTGPGAANVIPGSVELQGSIRAMSQDTFSRVTRRVEEVVNATAASAGCQAADWSWSARPYPPVVNDEGLAKLVATVGRRLESASAAGAGAAAAAGGSSDAETSWGGGGKSSSKSSDGSERSSERGGSDGGAPVRYAPLESPTLAAEDFAMYNTVGGIPSCFVFLGMSSPGPGGRVAALHTPEFQVEEARLPAGAALHAALALEALGRPGAGGRNGTAAAVPPRPAAAAGVCAAGSDHSEL